MCYSLNSYSCLHMTFTFGHVIDFTFTSQTLSMQPSKIYSLCLMMKHSISWLGIQDCDCCCMDGLKFEQR
ncbi:hypothetical protein Hanom_Chr16g01474481 [Helianthus anomalus]